MSLLPVRLQALWKAFDKDDGPDIPKAVIDSIFSGIVSALKRTQADNNNSPVFEGLTSYDKFVL